MMHAVLGPPSLSNSEPVLRQLRLHRREHSDIDGFASLSVAVENGPTLSI